MSLVGYSPWGHKESKTTEATESEQDIYNLFRFFCTYCCCYSVVQSCLTLCYSMYCSTPGFPVLHHLPEFAQSDVIELVMPSNYLILCHLLLLPSIFSSIRVYSNELALHIRWPKYWSVSFSISPSDDCSGLISFRIDWLAILAVQGTLKSISITLWNFHTV